MDSILTSNDPPAPKLLKTGDKKAGDEEMRADADESKSKNKKNGGRQKVDILEDTSDDNDSIDQIIDTDEFAKLHRQFTK